MANGERFGDEIQRQVRNNQIVLGKLKKEETHLSGKFTYDDGTPGYDATLMWGQILERSYEKWREELSVLLTVEEQDIYYRTVIYPHIKHLEERIEKRHRKYRHRSLYVIDSTDDDDNAIYDKNNIANLPDYVDFDNEIFSCSHSSLHELAEDPALCIIIKELTDEQRAIIHQIALLEYSTMKISVIKKTTDRNVRKTKNTALTHIRGQYLPVVMFKYKIQTQKKYHWLFVRGVSTTHWERLFAATIGEEYTDYYSEYEVDEKTEEDTLRYIEYFNSRVFDFVEITRDYRAQHQRDLDWIANWKDIKRRRKALDKKKKALRKYMEDSKMIDDDSSYEEGADDDYAQDI
jgi:hypothetical protein